MQFSSLLSLLLKREGGGGGEKEREREREREKMGGGGGNITYAFGLVIMEQMVFCAVQLPPC